MLSTIYTVSAEEVYGTRLEIPEGYEVVAFRPPEPDETYLSTGGIIWVGMCAAPRFILKQVETKITVERVIRIIGPRAWVEDTLSKCLVGPLHSFSPGIGKFITEVSRKEI